MSRRSRSVRFQKRQKGLRRVENAPLFEKVPDHWCEKHWSQISGDQEFNQQLCEQTIARVLYAHPKFRKLVGLDSLRLRKPTNEEVKRALSLADPYCCFLEEEELEKVFALSRVNSLLKRGIPLAKIWEYVVRRLGVEVPMVPLPLKKEVPQEKRTKSGLILPS